jgi:sugar/nucleoside kinase (ribokinase family)
MDLAIKLDQLPEPGGDVFGEDTGMHVGGGFNVIYAARQMGADVEYAGSLGRGPFSDAAREGLTAIGVQHTGPVVPGDLGYSVAVTDASSERTFISTRGAETRDPLGAFDNLTLDSKDVVYVSGYSMVHPANRSALGRLFERLGAHTQTIPRVVFDTSPVVADIPLASLRAIAELSPIWSTNERESSLLCTQLGGVAGSASDNARKLSRKLGKVLVRVGSAGAWYSHNGEEPRHIPTHTVKAIDTNGAGDTHSGVLCALLAEGMELCEALLWANVAGALSTTVSGPATCPPRDRVATTVESIHSS